MFEAASESPLSPLHHADISPGKSRQISPSTASILESGAAFEHDIGNLFHEINSLAGLAIDAKRPDLAKALELMTENFFKRDYLAIRPLLEKYGHDIAALDDHPQITAYAVSFVSHLVGTRRNEPFQFSIFEDWLRVKYHKARMEAIKRSISISGPGDLSVLTDRGAVLRIAKNLVKNAFNGRTMGIDPARNISVDLRVSFRGSKSYLAMKVSDDGAGFAAGVLERLLEPGIKTGASGHGLGLPIVAGIVSELQGSLEICTFPKEGGIKRLRPDGVIESSEGSTERKGTTVEVYIPCLCSW